MPVETLKEKTKRIVDKIRSDAEKCIFETHKWTPEYPKAKPRYDDSEFEKTGMWRKS